MVVDQSYYGTDNEHWTSDPGGTEQGFAFNGEVLERAIRRIYARELNTITEIEEGLWREFWRGFNQAADEGFGVREPINNDYNFYQELRYNNGVFAAFRTHRFQNDIVTQLLDENNELKPFGRFASDVKEQVAPKHLRQWLNTEYNTAVIRARHAADWRQFERQKDILPNLEWMPSTSVTPGEDHRGFWNIIRSIDDPFWNRHRPGDRWNCKCGLEATDAEVTETNDPEDDRPSPGLDNNPGKDARIFSDTHPHIADTYKGAQKAVREFIDELLKQPESLRYKEAKTYKSGGKVLIHPDVDKKKDDYKDIYTIANNFARKGEEVKITPSVHFKSEAYQEIYGVLNGTKYERKCPDLQIGDYFYEYESYVPPFKKEKIPAMIGHGLKQSSRIIINNNKGASDRYIKKVIVNRVRIGQVIDEVWIYEKGKVRLLPK